MEESYDNRGRMIVFDAYERTFHNGCSVQQKSLSRNMALLEADIWPLHLSSYQLEGPKVRDESTRYEPRPKFVKKTLHTWRMKGVHQVDIIDNFTNAELQSHWRQRQHAQIVCISVLSLYAQLKIVENQSVVRLFTCHLWTKPNKVNLDQTKSHLLSYETNGNINHQKLLAIN